MPQSPSTLTRRRHSSSLSLPPTPTKSQMSSPTSRPGHRRTSVQSTHSPPTTPRSQILLDRGQDILLSNNFSGTGNLEAGSLADELAEEGWIDAEEAEDSPPDFYSGLRTDDTASSCHCSQIAEGIRVSSPSNSPQNKNGSINSTGSNKAEGCTRLKGNDGSDYGEESNSDEGGDVLPALEAQGALIESLAWHYDASFDSDAFIRMTTQLKELGSQVNIENHIMRLATSHMALTAHVARQGRALTSLMHPLVSPLAVPPSVETIDSLLPVISSLILSLPQPCESALPSIHALHHGSIDVLSSLSYLSDNLYMTRQTTTLATRRLRTAREVAGTMKQEIDKAEEGERWLEVGSWALKLRRREAARVCREVVEGFDEVLKGHRKRLEMDVVV